MAALGIFTKSILLLIAITITRQQADLDWQPICTQIPDELRLDCHPAENASEQFCQSRGCCWRPALSGAYNTAPYCFFPSNYPGYDVKAVHYDSAEYTTAFDLEKSFPSHLPDEIKTLRATVSPYNEGIIRLKIYDPNNTRFEVPYVLKDRLKTGIPLDDVELDYGTNPFSVKLNRKSNGQTLLDTSVGPLQFANQFIELSTTLPADYVYGLGEHRTQFQISTNWRRMAFYTRDQATVRDDNLYSNHPFLMSIDEGGDAFGFFMLNSNAMEMIFQPYPLMTYRTIGGIIDLFVMTGPTPADVIRQYWTLVGSPIFTPYWTLGFHLSRWNYGTIADLKEVINSMKQADFPYDVQWTDIDALDNKRIFTYDRVNWDGLPALVAQLHSENKKYISINDPGISCNLTISDYPTYHRGVEKDVYVKWANGSGDLVGEVWPGLTVYPSWFHPNSFSWWADELIRWDAVLPIDGLWIDMNEVSSFVYGSVEGCHEQMDNPYYVPKIFEKSLWAKTICPSALHYGGLREYDVHNIYGHRWAMATHQGMLQLRPTRPFILTRSSFSGSGNHTAKWGGDNFATYDDMYYSITDILNFNMFGFSLTGDDVCGFIFDTTEELCTRWHQLGAFYTFMRNHNIEGAKPQHPSAFSQSATQIMKSSVIGRYRLLPYMYTLMYESHTMLKTVFQPMFFQWWKDANTHSIDTQFMVGDGLLVVPVLQQNHRQVYAYFPESNDRWYNFYNYKLVAPGDFSGWKLFDAPIDRINVFLKSGHIIPMHIVEESNSKNAMDLKNVSKFKLVFASIQNGRDASGVGTLFWDDGESQLSDSKFNEISFIGGHGFLSINPVTIGYEVDMILDEITVTGFQDDDFVNHVTVDDSEITTFSFDSESKSLTITKLGKDLKEAHTIGWRSAHA